MGLEKVNIKYRQSGPLLPRKLLVATVRGLQANSGLLDIRPGQPLPASLQGKICPPRRQGAPNLAWAYSQRPPGTGCPWWSPPTRFPTDSDAELGPAGGGGAPGRCLASPSQGLTVARCGGSDHAVVAACKQPSESGCSADG